MTEPETLEKPRYAVGDVVYVKATIVRVDRHTTSIRFQSDGDDEADTLVWPEDIAFKHDPMLHGDPRLDGVLVGLGSYAGKIPVAK